MPTGVALADAARCPAGLVVAGTRRHQNLHCRLWPEVMVRLAAGGRWPFTVLRLPRAGPCGAWRWKPTRAVWAPPGEKLPPGNENDGGCCWQQRCRSRPPVHRTATGVRRRTRSASRLALVIVICVGAGGVVPPPPLDRRRRRRRVRRSGSRLARRSKGIQKWDICMVKRMVKKMLPPWSVPQERL